MLSPIERPHPLPSLRRLFSEARPCSSSRRALTPPWTRHPSTRSPPCSSAVCLFCSCTLSLRAAAAEDASQPPLVSSVAPPPPVLVVQWNLTQKHILVLNAIACVTAISAAWLFFSAIPALLAFKRASESMEKLLDVTREELPDTMAAVRLSGMEISDLTMELSDLGQEITQGVRNSTRAVRVAEDKLRRLTNMAPTGTSRTKSRDGRSSSS